MLVLSFAAMGKRFLLPGPAPAPARGALQSCGRFLFATWPGRLLLGALGVAVLGWLGAPVPGVVRRSASVLLWVYGIVFGLWLLRRVLRRLLWKIRTKLILSYLFIAVVPAVLLTLFFVIAGALFAVLVASRTVSLEIQRLAETLEASAQDALAGGASAVGERLATAKRVHPELAFSLLQGGRVVSVSGNAPRAVPGWVGAQGFAGLVRDNGRELLCAVARRGDTALLLEAPLDGRTFKSLEERTSIRILKVGGSAQVNEEDHGIEIKIQESAAKPIGAAESTEPDSAGINAFALPDATDWETGKVEPLGIYFHFSPLGLIPRLSRGSFDSRDLFVKGLAIIGVLFLVVDSFALILGLLLARSITKSVHALHVGTERLRRGDFAHTIRVRSRDQLGELAESFNVMGRGIQDLLREQAEKERLEEELRIARTIQMSLLPPAPSGLAGLRVAALCLPAAEVGGDYYDLLPLSDTRLCVLVADVSGKGTSAALYMAELKGLVLSLSRIYDSPRRLLCEANRILSANMDSRSFITMTYAVVDTAKRTMDFARAGHNPIIQLQGESGRTRVLAPQGLGLGIDPGERFDSLLEEAQVPLERGDLFLFFTDGLSEAMNEQSELFGEHRLRDIIEQARRSGFDEAQLKDRILAEIRDFVGGAAQHDDMTMVILRVA